MTLEDQIVAEFNKEMTQAIDWQIMAGMLSEMGWTVVQVPVYIDNYHAIDIREWVDVSCKGKSDNHGATWIFENPADATMFSLRWL